MALGIAGDAASLRARILAMLKADTRFLYYRRVSPGWVAARVELYVDGQNVFSERYSAIRVNPALDPAIFDPRQFTQRHWEK